MGFQGIFGGASLSVLEAELLEELGKKAQTGQSLCERFAKHPRGSIYVTLKRMTSKGFVGRQEKKREKGGRGGRSLAVYNPTKLGKDLLRAIQTIRKIVGK
jgi:DNA-binding PadR family transcriptional regulator